MITVQMSGDDFDSESIMNEVMEDLAEDLRQEVGDLRCPKHGEEPVVEIFRDEEGELGWNIKSCCDELHAAVESRIEAMD